MPEATIVSPRGDVSEYGAARFFRRTGEGVYDMDDLARATDKMAGFIAGLVAEHKPSEVIGLGYSNGANIMANLLIEKGSVFDKAALLHPLLPFRPKDNPALKGAKILMTAGQMDPICPRIRQKRLHIISSASKPRSSWSGIRAGTNCARRNWLPFSHSSGIRAHLEKCETGFGYDAR